jgi:hypothetical protein
MRACRDWIESEKMMNESVRLVRNLAFAAAFAMVLGACETTGSQQAALQEPVVAPEMPATIRADQIVGRWGVASYQAPKDRTRSKLPLKDSANCRM